MSQHHRSGAWTTKDANQWRPRIAAQLPLPCVDCQRPVYPDQAWDLGHIIPVSSGLPRSELNVASNIGASHKSCNRSAGGRMGARVRNAARRQESDYPW